MAGLSLREAAQQVGAAKSTILRAIQAGRMSATRTDVGGYAIDPAELFRVFAPRSIASEGEGAGDGAHQAEHQSAGHGAPGDATAALQLVRLEAELGAVKQLLEAERRRSEELREDRDRWHAQAERLVPAPSLPAPARGLLARVLGG